MRIALLAGLSISLVPTAAFADHSETCASHRAEHQAIVGKTQAMAMINPRSEGRAQGPVTVFLNRAGGTLSPGYDDSASATSSLVYAHGLESLEVPGFRGSKQQWTRIVSCVRDKLAEFDIEITDDRPRSGDYIMAMVGGRPDMLGYQRGVSGIAPYSGSVIASAIVFVFERELRADPTSVCTSAVHEIGHALGLEHAYLCEDPMSYLHGCGDKSFRDEDAWCGEYEARECESGGQQNSWQHLARVVGVRDGSKPTPRQDTPTQRTDDPPTRHHEPTAHDQDDQSYDDEHASQSLPTVSLVSAKASYRRGKRRLEIVIAAAAESGLADLELAWVTPDSSLLMTCSAMPSDIPATCRRRGRDWVFSLNVGTGRRAFAVRATDRDGNQNMTPGYALQLE